MIRQFLIQVQFSENVREVRDEVVFELDIANHVQIVARNHTEGAVPKVNVSRLEEGDLIRARRVIQELDYLNSDEERRNTVCTLLDLAMRLRQLINE